MFIFDGGGFWTLFFLQYEYKNLTESKPSRKDIFVLTYQYFRNCNKNTCAQCMFIVRIAESHIKRIPVLLCI